LLIVAGDVAPDFGRPGATIHAVSNQKLWLSNEFAEWLRSRPGDPTIVGIGGNHDFALEQDVEFARALPWNYLLDESFTFEGVKLWGVPWVPNGWPWAFQLDDFLLDMKFKEIPDDTNIVVSHGPPYGFSDHAVPTYGAVHAGFPGTLDMIERVTPELFVCGHIHEAYGRSIAPSGTLVANVSHMTVTYEPLNAPLLVKWLDEVRRGAPDGVVYRPWIDHMFPATHVPPPADANIPLSEWNFKWR
jgi:Icc-related predicted phosphoesterase